MGVIQKKWNEMKSKAVAALANFVSVPAKHLFFDQNLSSMLLLLTKFYFAKKGLKFIVGVIQKKWNEMKTEAVAALANFVAVPSKHLHFYQNLLSMLLLLT